MCRAYSRMTKDTIRGALSRLFRKIKRRALSASVSFDLRARVLCI